MVSPAGGIGRWMTGRRRVLYSPSFNSALASPLETSGSARTAALSPSGGEGIADLARGADLEVGVGALDQAAVGEEEAGDLFLSCARDGRDLGVLHGEEAVRVREARGQGADYEVVAVEGDEGLEGSCADDLLSRGIRHGAVTHGHLEQDGTRTGGQERRLT